MQYSLARLSSQFLPSCKFVRTILHPTSRFVSQSIRVLDLRKEYWFSIGSGVSCLLWNSRRNYIRGVDEQSGEERFGNETTVWCIERNKRITKYGQKGKWREILQLFEREKSEFDNVNWATTFYRLGRIRDLDRGDPVFKSFVNEYAACLETGGLEWAGVRQISNVMFVSGKMHLRNPATESILGLLSRRENARKLIQEGNAQDIANTAWAFATLGMPLPKLFAEIEKRTDWLLKNGTPQSVANTAWSFATLNVKAPKFFVTIEKRAYWLVMNENTHPQDIAYTAWAFAKLEIKSPKLFAAIDKRSGWLVEEGNSENIANAAWAFATLGVVPSPKLFDEIEKRADWLVTEGSPQHVANIAKAFVTLGLPYHNLFAAVERRVDKK